MSKTFSHVAHEHVYQNHEVFSSSRRVLTLIRSKPWKLLGKCVKD